MNATFSPEEANAQLEQARQACASVVTPAPVWYLPALAALMSLMSLGQLAGTVIRSTVFVLFFLGICGLIRLFATATGMVPRFAEARGRDVWPMMAALISVFIVAALLDTVYDRSWGWIAAAFLAPAAILVFGLDLQRRARRSPMSFVTPPRSATATLDVHLHLSDHLRLCALLDGLESAEARVVREKLGITEAELDSHLEALVERGYLKRQKTWLSLTKQGRTAYRAHLAALRAIAA